VSRSWRRAAAILAATVGVGVVSASENRPLKEVTIYGGLVALGIPSEWREISEFELEEATFRAAEMTGGRVVEVYQHGFRPLNPPDDSGTPQLLIQIRESGRLGYGRFLELPPLENFQDDALSSYPEGVPPLVVGVEVDRVAFDRETYSVLLEHSLSLRFIGRVRVFTAAYLTERGFLILHLTDRETRIGDSRALFHRILSTLEIGPEIAYRPRITDRWPGFPFFVAAGVLTIVLVVFIVRRRRP
jgi:hypothetical protein